MPKDKLLKIMIKRETERVFLNQKKEETKKSLQAKKNVFKLKRENKKSLYKHAKRLSLNQRKMSSENFFLVQKKKIKTEK